MNHGMKDLITLINRLQDAASTAGMSLGSLDLPQIAVVGGQSAGKSSVLENFVGRDFLPRGSGIVTRRPLVLQLMPSKEEYAEFLHLEKERFTDFMKIREEIQNETDRLTGTGKAISRIPINLRIFSPNVLQLTLVDLPGLTRVPVGDQPADIEEQIRNMVLEYIADENTLILAVSPANQDIANSDALKLAHLVDPDGDRTIGVLTKLDLMDRGTDAREILENKVYRLQRGYIGIVNRSQQDIDSEKDIKTAQQEEMDFFNTHEAYRLIQIFIDDLNTDIIGYSINVKGDKYSTGAKINSCFYREIYNLIRQVTCPNEKELEIIVQNLHGYRNGNFTCGLAFDIAVRNLLEKYRDPLEISVDMISTFVISSIIECAKKFNDFPKLKEIIIEILGDRLKIQEEKTKKHLKIHIDAQMVFMNTRHPDFCFLPAAIVPVVDRVQQIGSRQTSKTNLSGKMNFEPKTDSNELSSKSSDDISVLSENVSRDAINENPSNSLKRQNSAVPGSKIIQKGWILICGTSMVRKSKEYWFVLTPEFLIWYRNNDEKEMLGNIPVDGLSLTKHPKHKRFVLSRKEGEQIHKDFLKMHLLFRSETDENIWYNACRQVGINVVVAVQNMEEYFVNDKSSPAEGGWKETLLRIKNPQDNKTELAPPQGVQLLIKMIQSYMKIVETTILDLVPKYILLLLVDKILEFTRHNLFHEITSQQAWLELMEESGEETAKKKKLMVIYQTMKKALEILKEVSFS